VSADGLARQRLASLESRPTFRINHSREPLGPRDVDVYVVDVRDLHRLSGRLSPVDPGLAVPLVIAFGPGEHLRAAFLAGCADYLKEPWDLVEVEARLDRVLYARTETAGAAWGFVLEGRELRLPDGRSVRLSAHEAVVAGLLFANRGVIVSRRALAFALWGRIPPETSRAVDMHVSGLRRKVGRDLISCVRGQGYVVSVVGIASDHR